MHAIRPTPSCGFPSPLSLLLVSQLLPPLESLQTLVLTGCSSDWPYLWLDWRWLAGMQQARAVQCSALLCLAGSTWHSRSVSCLSVAAPLSWLCSGRLPPTLPIGPAAALPCSWRASH